MAVNPASNFTYVANGTNVTVIDGRNNSTVAVSIGGAAFFPTVDTVTNKVYVANGGNL